MEQTQRFRTLLLTLASKGIIANQQDLADKLGYPKATMSSIVNGRIPTSDKFLRKLKSVLPIVNTNWLTTGEGEMFEPDNTASTSGNTGGINQSNTNGDNMVHTIDDRFIAIFEEQTKQLSTAQQQITDLIQLLKK